MATCKTSAQRLRRLEREAQALDLRRQGLRLDDIAAQIGVSRSGAHQLLTAAMQRMGAQIQALADEERLLELARLDELWRPVYALALTGDLPAVDRCLRIMERRARLLGLDAPERQEQVVTEGLRPIIRVIFDGSEDLPAEAAG